MRRFIVIESARKYILFKLALRKSEHFFGGVVVFKKHCGDFIDSFVRALRREDDGNQKLVRAFEMQGRLCVGIQGGKLV